MLKIQKYNVVTITLHNFISPNKLRKEESNYIFMELVTLTFFFGVFFLFISYCLSYHLLSLPYFSTALFPPTFSVLLHFIWHIYLISIWYRPNNTIIYILFYVYKHKCEAFVLKSVTRKTEEICHYTAFIITYIIILTSFFVLSYGFEILFGVTWFQHEKLPLSAY